MLFLLYQLGNNPVVVGCLRRWRPTMDVQHTGNCRISVELPTELQCYVSLPAEESCLSLISGDQLGHPEPQSTLYRMGLIRLPLPMAAQQVRPKVETRRDDTTRHADWLAMSHGRNDVVSIAVRLQTYNTNYDTRL